MTLNLEQTHISTELLRPCITVIGSSPSDEELHAAKMKSVEAITSISWRSGFSEASWGSKGLQVSQAQNPN